MLEDFVSSCLDSTDLNIYECGIEDCSPGYAFGNAIRDHYVIHYILEGEGIFKVANRTYPLQKNQGFLICPDSVTYYRASETNPWSYAWVGFHGIKVDSYLKQSCLTLDDPIFCYDRDDFLKECLINMINCKSLCSGRDARMLGYLLIFLSRLMEEAKGGSVRKAESTKEIYVKKALEYITMNYCRSISISEISSHIGIDRSYLCLLFKHFINKSPKEYLLQYRINKACELMSSHSLLLSDISRSVGYEDPLLFSKAFKKVKGISPRKFKKGI